MLSAIALTAILALTAQSLLVLTTAMAEDYVRKGYVCVNQDGRVCRVRFRFVRMIVPIVGCVFKESANV